MNSIIPNRGIREGDPLSPFIFILCSEIFSRLMKRNNDIQGIKIYRRALAISHLLYVDDILVACRANSQNAKAIQEMLNVYSQWSGQLPSFDKSKILFSKNTPGRSKMSIKELLEFKELKSGSIYLAFKDWGSLRKPKDSGGLDFRKFKDINSALLAKLGWKLAKGEDCLWTRILSAKYLHNKSFFGSRFKAGDSYVWISILSSKEVVKKGSCFKIGNEWLVNPWTDPWVPDNAEKISKIKDGAEEALAWRVVDLLNPLYLSWNESKLHQTFDQDSIEAIKRVKIHGADRIWKDIWTTKIHERLKMFLWKVYADVLPLKNTLFERQEKEILVVLCVGSLRKLHPTFSFNALLLEPLPFVANEG
nr:uncharacterized protein LOC125424269 [Ziziphus jujuba var. spinosa]